MQTLPLRTQMPRRKPQWAALLPALAAGLAAAGLAFLLVRSRLPAEAAASSVVAVVVAARDIPPRTLLTAAALRLRSISVSDVPAGASKTPAQFIGKVSVLPIAAGSPLTQSAVVVPDASLGMAFALPPSLRAVTVATDPADGVDLFVRPQDHVDILATDEPGSGPAEARTVLQNVLLLAVGSQTSSDPPASAPTGGAAHVTVAVTPAQAQALVLAAARGHLHLALRAINDGSENALPALPAAPVPRHSLGRAPGPIAKIGPLPPMPVSLLPVKPPLAAPTQRTVTVTIIKGALSQTVSVAP